MSKHEKRLPDHIHAEPEPKPKLVPDIQATRQDSDKQSQPE